jgi:hypothetical protein
MPPENTPENTSQSDANVIRLEASQGVSNADIAGISRRQDELAQRQESDKTTILIFLTGLTVFVAITFLLEIWAMHSNYLQDKSLATQNNQLIKDNYDKTLEMMLQVNELEHQYELLKARNTYLK